MIQIEDSLEFKKLITTLSDDIVDAHIHWKLYRNLSNALEKQQLVWAQSRTFWYLTLNAHIQTSVSLLCRAFDQEQKSLHLLSWLKTIKANINLFERSEFKIRLKDNEYVDSLAELNRIPNLDILESDIRLCSDSDPLVKKLIIHRGNVVAHRSVKRALNRRPLLANMLLTDEEYEELLNRAIGILNSYTYLYGAETYSINMIGHDDFKYVFYAVNNSVEQSRKQSLL